MTSLSLLNFLLLQWFGVRLAVRRVTLTASADFARRGDAVCTYADGVTQYWRVERVDSRTQVTLCSRSLLRWVWPLTGWWSDYRWIARRK